MYTGQQVFRDDVQYVLCRSQLLLIHFRTGNAKELMVPSYLFQLLIYKCNFCFHLDVIAVNRIGRCYR